jgi:hypothetical protein
LRPLWSDVKGKQDCGCLRGPSAGRSEWNKRLDLALERVSCSLSLPNVQSCAMYRVPMYRVAQTHPQCTQRQLGRRLRRSRLE